MEGRYYKREDSFKANPFGSLVKNGVLIKEYDNDPKFSDR